VRPPMSPPPPNGWPDTSASRTKELAEGLAIELVAFRLRGLRFAVDAALVRGMTEVKDPNTPALADLLGLGTTPAPLPLCRERVLRLRQVSQHNSTFLEVRVEEPLSLRRLPANRLYPLPGLMTATSVLPCVRGLARFGEPWTDDLTILLDTRHLPAMVV
jgi:hypothetical protein